MLTPIHDFGYVVEGLRTIVDKYPVNSDPLSLSLYIWAGDLFDEADSLRFAPPGEQMSAAIRQINKLFSEVVAANPAPHPFAEEVARWGSGVRARLPVGNRELRVKMDEALDEILGALAEQEAIGEESRLQLRVRLKEREENLALELAEVQHEIDARLLMLEGELAAKKEQHLQNLAAAEARLAERKKGAADTFVQLQGKLSLAEAASSVKIQAVGQEIRRVTQIQEQTGAQLASVRSQTLAATAELQKLESSLRAEEEEIKRRAVEIEQINRTRGELQPMIAHARKAKNKLQNRPCVVM